MSVEVDEGTPSNSEDEELISVAVEEIRRYRSQVREQELEKAFTKLNLDTQEALVLSLLSERLVRRITSGPIRTLEQTDDKEVAKVALSLFDSSLHDELER